jgi:hypothetical protein
MGNKRNVTVSLLIYVLCTIILSSWYIILHRYEELINSIIKVVINVGLIGAIVPAIIFSLIYYLLKKVSNKLLLTFLIFILFIILIFSVYWNTVNMVFYHIGDAKSFLQSLLEIF